MDNAMRSPPARKPEPCPHRNQFALAQGLSPPENWLCEDLGACGTLIWHPDLSLTRTRGHGQELILLGDLFDWRRPTESNQQALTRLIRDKPTLDSLLAASAELGGRWVMLRLSGDEAAMFHDAAGLRAICYGSQSDGRLAAASDQGMLSRIAGLAPDPNALAFAEAFSRRVSQWWLPGDKLLFEGGRQLLPNHVLCLRTGATRRYWPSGDITGDPVEVLLERCAARIEGSISAAANRYPLAIGLSAGWDSRLLLAFCRKLRDRIRIYSTVPPERGPRFTDADIPASLCAKLGMRHEILSPNRKASAEFSRAFQTHVYRPLVEFEPFMESELAFSEGQVAGVTGNIAEVVKLPYGGKVHEPDFDNRIPAHLARLVQMQGFDYAEIAVDRWRNSAIEHPSITIPELFYWENRCGRWLSRNALMFDLGWREIVMPFNCRALLSDFLELPAELRSPPNFNAFESLIRQQWPEVLCIPVVSKTPITRSRRLWSKARRTVRRLLRGRSLRAGAR